LRLCRRVPGLAFEGRIHELLTPFFLARKLPIGSLNAVIHHFGKVDVGREAEKKVAYLHLAEDQAQAHPQSPQAWFNLMSQAALAAEWPRVIKAAETYLRLERQVPLPVLTTLALAHQETGNPGKGVPLLKKVLTAEPRHRLALVLLPQLLLQAGLLPESIKAFRQALPIHPDVADLHLGLAGALVESGKSAEAVETLRAALGLFPKLTPLWERLIQLRLAEGQQAQATAEAWEALRALPEGGGGHWHALVAGFLLQAGQAPQARAILELGLRLHPSHEGLRRLRDLDS
jgi:tetratricopeptide (TPR) repeat protein